MTKVSISKRVQDNYNTKEDLIYSRELPDYLIDAVIKAITQILIDDSSTDKEEGDK